SGLYRLLLLSLTPPSFLFTLRRPPSSTLFPYTTLFRSWPAGATSAAPATRPSAPRSSPGSRWRRCATAPRACWPTTGCSRWRGRSGEHTAELQSLTHLVCRLLLLKKKNIQETLESVACA